MRINYDCNLPNEDNKLKLIYNYCLLMNQKEETSDDSDIIIGTSSINGKTMF